MPLPNPDRIPIGREPSKQASDIRETLSLDSNGRGKAIWMPERDYIHGDSLLRFMQPGIPFHRMKWRSRIRTVLSLFSQPVTPTILHTILDTVGGHEFIQHRAVSCPTRSHVLGPGVLGVRYVRLTEVRTTSSLGTSFSLLFFSYVLLPKQGPSVFCDFTCMHIRLAEPSPSANSKLVALSTLQLANLGTEAKGNY